MKKSIVVLVMGIFLVSSLNLVFGLEIDIENEKKQEIFQLPSLFDDGLKSDIVTYKSDSISEPEHADDDLTLSFNDEVFDYVIITTDELVDSIQSSDFIPWKRSLGFSIKIVTVSDSEIDDQDGTDLPQKIRNFLREYYQIWEIEYVLIVGDHDAIPMRYCYPDPSNHVFTGGTVGGSGGDVPTDYYYADLSLSDDDSWDSDLDGFFGEYGQDNPDFEAEVSVGRIPTVIPSRITYALDKTVVFEQDTSDWKDSALHGGAFWYFTDETGIGNPAYDGANCMNEIEQNLMDSWTISHFSEQEGLEVSVFDWPALTENAFAGGWKNEQFCMVNWGAHGWSDGAYNKIWEFDDGDNVPEGNEISWRPFISSFSNLDDDHPSIVFGISCVINYPEKNPSGQIGVDLLTKPVYGSAVGVVASTRSPWGTSSWPENPGGSESICYEFNRFIISEKDRVGDAFYNAMYYCNLNYGWEAWQEYNNLYCFNLYGDPSLVREGIENDNPLPPTIDGPTSGKVGEDLEFSFKSIDPKDDDLYYFIDWDDGSDTGWLGPYPSNQEILVKHDWSNRGSYVIKAKVKDENDNESPFSYFDQLEISKAKNKMFSNLLRLDFLFSIFFQIFKIIF